MLKIYSTGCIKCLEAVRLLHKKAIPFVVIDEHKEVERIATSTIGVVPVFEVNGNFYNHAQMKNMINANFDFSDKVVETIIEEVIVEKPIEEIVNNVVEEITVENIDIIEPKIINKKNNRRTYERN